MNKRTTPLDPHDYDLRITLELEPHGIIALIWSIEDVKSRRPDLTDGEAWEVLRSVKKHHDASLGVTWETLEEYAHALYPQDEDTGGSAR